MGKHRNPRRLIPLLERFNAKWTGEPNSGCWLWLGPYASTGYGEISAGKHKDGTLSAHRVSWTLHRGPIPDGAHVLHRCDVRPCVNPDHLFLGTHADNVQDMIRKQRQRNQIKTHCSRGHPFSGITKRGRRMCHQCHAAGALRRYHLKKERQHG